MLLDLGPGWKYFKGRSEPVPYAVTVSPRWTKGGFDDTDWLSGSTGIGYGDGDDATVLDDMRGDYSSVYMRRNFTLPEDANLRAIQLSINYDDGFVAYLNGREIARSANMEEAGNPPPHDALATQNRESNQGDQIFLTWLVTISFFALTHRSIRSRFRVIM